MAYQKDNKQAILLIKLKKRKSKRENEKENIKGNE